MTRFNSKFTERVRDIDAYCFPAVGYEDHIDLPWPRGAATENLSLCCKGLCEEIHVLFAVTRRVDAVRLQEQWWRRHNAHESRT